MDAIRNHLVALVAVGVTWIPSAFGQRNAGPSPWVTGTYSNLTYNEEGGDLLGWEIQLIPSRNGFKAVVQFAEGGEPDVALADVAVSGGQVHFVLSAPFFPPGEFDGTVSPKGLEGAFKDKGGSPEHLVLPRGTSYWQRRRK